MKLCTIDGTSPLQVVAVGDSTSCTTVAGTALDLSTELLTVEQTAELSVAVVGVWAIAWVFKTIARSIKIF